MTSSRNNDKIVEDLASSLQFTTDLMNKLLGEIQDNATTLAVLRENLRDVKDDFDSLKQIVTRGNGKGAMITRLALIEKDIENIYSKIIEQKEDLERELENNRVSRERVDGFEKKKKMEILKLIIVSSPGIITLVHLLIKSIFGIV